MNEKADLNECAAYQSFCHVVIEKIIGKYQVYRMNTLTQMLDKLLHSVNKGKPLQDYLPYKLKHQLMAKYPELSFIKSSRKNFSEIVICESNLKDLVESEITVDECLSDIASHTSQATTSSSQS